MTQLSGVEAKTLVDTTTSAIDRGSVTLHIGASSLDAAHPKVYRVTSSGEEFATVTLPVRGGHSLSSNVTVLFDSDGRRIDYAETLYSRGPSGNFHLTKYENGTLSADQDTDLVYMTDAELTRAPAPQPAQDAGTPGVVLKKSTGDKVACVSSVLGVSGAVGYLIVGACAGACAAAETGVTIPVCVACIGAYAAFGGASVTAVASCF